MTSNQIHDIAEKQREFFLSGATLSNKARKSALLTLKSMIVDHESEILDALRLDLGKSAVEAYMCETGIAISEVNFMLKHLTSFNREKKVNSALALFPAKCFEKPSPRGLVLIMSPWNYPFMLSIDPMIDALAAGNTVILKPSAYSPHTSSLIARLISEHFDERLVSVVSGGRAENTALLEEHFDYIFFTGSQAVGKEVMAKAAKHLTPVTLELGGKSPCIIDKTADLKMAAKKIAFGKFLNCGQTCVAPDYLYVDTSVKDALLLELKKAIEAQYGPDPIANMDYGKIINQKHYQRLIGLIDEKKVVLGGNRYPETQQIAPTIMDHVSFEDAVMQEEIFGPILPVLTFDNLDSLIEKLNHMPHPLALYYFSRDRKAIQRITSEVGFGGGCINDTILHLATPHMGFGGFGESGMGAYHGKRGFDTFSHYKSIVNKLTFMDFSMRYQPYSSKKDRQLRMVVR